MILYLDTSAALKLVVDERESAGLATLLNAALDGGDDIVSSMLLYTEMHCAAGRRGELHIDTVNAVLDAVSLVDVTRGDLLRAATSSWGLRSADSIHLAAALRMECDVMLTYDAELAVASTRAGLRVEAPT